MSNVLSEEEKVNLLILAMKADGLNPNLLADDSLGEQAITAAREFIKLREKEMAYGYIIPPGGEITTAVLNKLTSNKNAGSGTIRLLSLKLKNHMEKFFADRGILL